MTALSLSVEILSALDADEAPFYPVTTSPACHNGDQPSGVNLMRYIWTKSADFIHNNKIRGARGCRTVRFLIGTIAFRPHQCCSLWLLFTFSPPSFLIHFFKFINNSTILFDCLLFLFIVLCSVFVFILYDCMSQQVSSWLQERELNSCFWSMITNMSWMQRCGLHNTK